jgi:hypothetical protein
MYLDTAGSVCPALPRVNTLSKIDLFLEGDPPGRSPADDEGAIVAD